MLGDVLGGSMFSVARQALNGLSRRQGVIAQNVANIDTPDYRRKEVTFEDALKVQLGTGSGPLAVTDPRHFAAAMKPATPGSTAAPVRDVVAERNDENDVNIDEEMMLLVDTQLRYQALAQTTGRRIATLRSVIRGQ